VQFVFSAKIKAQALLRTFAPVLRAFVSSRPWHLAASWKDTETGYLKTLSGRQGQDGCYSRGGNGWRWCHGWPSLGISGNDSSLQRDSNMKSIEIVMHVMPSLQAAKRLASLA